MPIGKFGYKDPKQMFDKINPSHEKYRKKIKYNSINRDKKIRTNIVHRMDVIFFVPIQSNQFFIFEKIKIINSKSHFPN